MSLKTKNRLLCLNPIILQMVILIMHLKITNPLVGESQTTYHGKPDFPARTWRVTWKTRY